MSSWRKKYPAHPATEVFPMLGGDDMDQLVADIDENGILVPVVMYRDDDGKVWTLDGRNRLEARERIRPGRDDWDLEGNPPDVPCIWANEEGYDPVSFVISANAHRRHLTPEQKRDLIARLLKRDASRSDRQIARDVRASPTTVGRERRKLEESGRVSKVDTRWWRPISRVKLLGRSSAAGGC